MSIVELGCPVAELGAAMSEMRSWLDHNDAEASQFELLSRSGDVIGIRLQFLEAVQASAFATAFNAEVSEERQQAGA